MKYQSIIISIGLSLASVALIISCNKPAIISTPDLPANTPSQSASSRKDHELRIAFSYNNWLGTMPWIICDQKNLFKSDAVTMKTVWYDDYLQGITGLTHGIVDAGSQTLVDTILSINNKSEQVIVLVSDNSKGNDKIIARSGIKNVSDLRNKIIAVQKGTADHYLVLLAIKKAGLAAKDITFEFMNPEQSVMAFKEGKVDAVALFTPFTKTALKTAGSREIISSQDFPEAISNVLSFNRNFLEKNPNQVQAAVNAWFGTLEYIKSHQKESDELLAQRANLSVASYLELKKGIKILTPEDNIKMFSSSNDQGSLGFSAKNINKDLVELGLSKKPSDLGQLFDNRFVKSYIASRKK
jgi:NitT/TauT family transport system substrate-binding protein